MSADELELLILGAVVDGIEAQATREEKIAALRCFVRGLQGGEIDLNDELMLRKGKM